MSVPKHITEDNSVGGPSLSASGRFVAFASSRGTLVPGDTNQARDVFVRDVVTGRLRRVSLSGGGRQGSSDSEAPALPADGRYVAVESVATNLVGDDTNGRPDVFIWDARRVPGRAHGG